MGFKPARNIPGFQERRNLGLPTDTPDSIRNVEDQIPTVAGGEATGESPDVPDAIHLMPQVAQVPVTRNNTRSG